MKSIDFSRGRIIETPLISINRSSEKCFGHYGGRSVATVCVYIYNYIYIYNVYMYVYVECVCMCVCVCIYMAGASAATELDISISLLPMHTLETIEWLWQS